MAKLCPLLTSKATSEILRRGEKVPTEGKSQLVLSFLRVGPPSDLLRSEGADEDDNKEKHLTKFIYEIKFVGSNPYTLFTDFPLLNTRRGPG